MTAVKVAMTARCVVMMCGYRRGQTMNRNLSKVSKMTQNSEENTTKVMKAFSKRHLHKSSSSSGNGSALAMEGLISSVTMIPSTAIPKRSKRALKAINTKAGRNWNPTKSVGVIRFTEFVSCMRRAYFCSSKGWCRDKRQRRKRWDIWKKAPRRRSIFWWPSRVRCTSSKVSRNPRRRLNSPTFRDSRGIHNFSSSFRSQFPGSLQQLLFVRSDCSDSPFLRWLRGPTGGDCLSATNTVFATENRLCSRMRV